MRILGFDTATRSISAALLDSDADLELEARDDPPSGVRPRHATRLMAVVVELLERAGGGWDAVDRIAVGVGPGTFTGLRIGVATARALAQARGIPLVGVSTLESLAFGAREGRSLVEDPAAVLAVLDAQRGEAFVAAWRLEPDAGAEPWFPTEALLEPCALVPSALARLVPEIARHTLAIGPGAIAFRAQLERSGAVIAADDSELHRVTALNHCQLAARSSVANGAGEILPDYIRLPDAELTRRRRRD